MCQKPVHALLGIFFTVLAVSAGSAQVLTDSARHKFDGQTQTISSRPLQHVTPQALHSRPGLFAGSSPARQSSIKGNPGGLPGIDSVPNFTRSFTSHGQVWPYTMIGNDPAFGQRTRIPAKIIAVTLELQNEDLVTTTKVPIEPFDELTLRSPNFEEADYSSGENIQYTDAIQRAQFFHSMKEDWHTELHPVKIVDRVTLQVPRFTTVDVDGVPTQVRTYFTGTTNEGGTFVVLLDSFFNDAFFNAVAAAITNNHFTTDALNIVLLPNTFLFSLDQGPQGSLTLGFHTFLFDDTVAPTPVWVTAFASWISPGLFEGGVEDVSALSHEIGESFGNPFLINNVPAWQFPGFPGTCQDNLEQADPIEALANEAFPVTLHEGRGSFTYHPQIEALLPWFEEETRPNAIHGAFSYPDTTALTGPANFFGQLTCPAAQ